jgi:hypothetical protein
MLCSARPSVSRSSMPRKTSKSPRSTGPEDLDRITTLLHSVVRDVAPNLRIVRKWANDWYAGNDLVCCIGAFTHHVGVEFWRGSTLKDPGHLLEGTGKNLRHVKVHTEDAVRSAAFARLVKEAVRLDKTQTKRAR